MKTIAVVLWFTYYVPTPQCLKDYDDRVSSVVASTGLVMATPYLGVLAGYRPEEHLGFMADLKKPTPRPDSCYEIYIGSVTLSAVREGR